MDVLTKTEGVVVKRLTYIPNNRGRKYKNNDELNSNIAHHIISSDNNWPLLT